jgi:flagellar basal body-associated protein FliL
LESKGTFFILIIVVAILTLTLAALAGYLFLVQGAPQAKSEVQAAVAETAVVPKEIDLATLELFDSKKYFNLKNNDPTKIAVIQVSVSLQYFKAIKEDKKLIVEEKVAAYQPEIKELVGTYFLNVSIDDVKMPDAKEKAKKELKKQINDLLNNGEKNKYEYVYKVIFDEWLYQ